MLDIEKNFLLEGGRGAGYRMDGVEAGDQEAIAFPFLPHSQDGICQGENISWMAWRQWAGQDDLKRAWPMSWNLAFCDSQRYGYRWEKDRLDAEFRKNALHWGKKRERKEGGKETSLEPGARTWASPL